MQKDKSTNARSDEGAQQAPTQERDHPSPSGDHPSPSGDAAFTQAGAHGEMTPKDPRTKPRPGRSFDPGVANLGRRPARLGGSAGERTRDTADYTNDFDQRATTDPPRTEEGRPSQAGGR